MTLRIFQEAKEHEVVIALHGWLSAAEVPEVERLAVGAERPLRIDLAQLAGVDAEGLRLLRRLRDGGARVTGASPFIELRLERAVVADTGKPQT
jgi:hypothetical protein